MKTLQNYVKSYLSNDRIKSGNKPVLWVEKDYTSVNTDRGNLSSYQAVVNKYDVNINFVYFTGCIRELKT